MNKFLEFLRTLGKFNQRHLWSNDEICAGDSFTIWGLLEDIMNYYSKRTSEKINYLPLKQKIKNSPEKSFNENFSLLQNSALTTYNIHNNSNGNRLLNNNTNKNPYNKIGLKELNVYSPINKIDDKDNKFTSTNTNNTNSDSFNNNNNFSNKRSRSNSKSKIFFEIK